MFDASTLEFKYKRQKYDSVYLSKAGNIVKVRQGQEEQSGLYLDEEITILPPGFSIEDEMKKVIEEGYKELVFKNSFHKALKNIANGNKDLEAYIDQREHVGQINPNVVISSLLRNDLDAQDYFIKRIIVVEIFIRQIKIELDC